MTFLRWAFKLAGVAVAFATIAEMVGAWSALGTMSRTGSAEHLARVCALAGLAAVLYFVGSLCRSRPPMRW